MTNSGPMTGRTKQTQALEEVAFRAGLLRLNASVTAAAGVEGPGHVTVQAVNEALAWITECVKHAHPGSAANTSGSTLYHEAR